MRRWLNWIVPAVFFPLVAVAVMAQSGLPFEALVRYVSAVTSHGAFPGQIQVVVGDNADPRARMWNQNDQAWEDVAGDAAALTAASVTASGDVSTQTITLTSGGASPIIESLYAPGATTILSMSSGNGIGWTGAGGDGALIAGEQVYATNTAGGAILVSLKTNEGSGGEVAWTIAADLAVVGTAQTVAPASNSVEIGAAASASVTIITAETQGGQFLVLHCKDGNVTINDSDGAGAVGSINLGGAATNFVCSSDDSLMLSYMTAPAAGNARWVEVSRSVN